ncbi:DUF6057 family protein [Bacteroides sp. OttesenSCG-928-E20]|nr:DUF6057 family protein [Bacteroides sp. OttesenSCG-928-N06]MDL2299853.1 DUF6057 family protein [Bacteroides sp. OttesenSCG-928-E20]MDL2305530.1 DUF6057 family protein [Bacteroides sp. OttesenSCG-928-D19]
MKQIGTKYLKVLSALLFAAAVFCFWAVYYPFALAWQEQFQLFLFDSQYLMERLAVPGGAAAYVAEFLVQFYNNPFLGAAVLAFIYLLLQTLVWRLMKRSIIPGSASTHSYFLFALSFLPSLLLWYAMGDENLMPTFAVALIMALSSMLFYPTQSRAQLLFSLFVLPLVYWLVGSVVVVPVLFIFVVQMRSDASWGIKISRGIGVLAYAFFLAWLSARFEPYSLRRLISGIYYYRIPEMLPYSILALSALCLLLVLFANALTHLFQPQKPKNQRLLAGVGIGLVIVLGVLFIPKGYDARKYELIEYDYLVRMNRWNDIVAKAEKQRPDLPMSVCATNLALGMTNQLGNRAFTFFQNGAGSLLPKFVRNFNTTQLTGEAYFQLGLVNTAQRYAFESMESIPNYNKSGRIMKRLAETNMINGQYKVAEKYLLMLKKTIFYRKWAQSRLEMLAHPELIDRHHVYGHLRKVRLTDDFLFSETELDKICGQLFSHNKENTLAMQYLLMFPLLNRDLNSFMSYFGYVNSVVRYNPIVCQEAVAFAYMQRKMEIPGGMVGNDVMLRFKNFAQVYASGGKDSPQLEAFRNTLWYYLMKG